ncbi:MAG: GyrI-like domain-containing protein [Spirochaetales bacterium]|nr:GyrI-like domain-containing protein [Spirochaetales bacterium]
MFSLFRIDYKEPEIKRIKKPIFFIGLEMNTTDRTIGRDIGILGKKFNKIKSEYPIENVKVPREFVAVTKDYDPVKGRMKYMMGDIISEESKECHPDLNTFQIPEGKYAVFVVKPKTSFLWGYTLGNMKQYIYRKWLPSSGYINAGTIDDFEYHDQRSLLKKPEIDLFVAIKDK